MNVYNLPWTTIYCIESSFLGILFYSELLSYRPDVYSLDLGVGKGLTRIYKNTRYNLVVI